MVIYRIQTTSFVSLCILHLEYSECNQWRPTASISHYLISSVPFFSIFFFLLQIKKSQEETLSCNVSPLSTNGETALFLFSFILINCWIKVYSGEVKRDTSLTTKPHHEGQLTQSVQVASELFITVITLSNSTVQIMTQHCYGTPHIYLIFTRQNEQHTHTHWFREHLLKNNKIKL